ncbi:MAG: APC family permease [Acidimicrobiales bacterium]
MAQTLEAPQSEDTDLQSFGYKQELRRTLSFFSNFGVAFCYLSPVVGIYSLFAFGVGTGGPAYIWTIPFVVAGQLLVSLVFAELGSSYPLAGALFQWAKQLLGRRYGWWVGWFYAWALIITVASVDTGITGYVLPLLNSWFKTNFDVLAPNDILVCTLVLLAIQTMFNVVGVRLTGFIARWGVWVEILGTFGVAIVLGVEGFHHGLGWLVSSAGATHVKTNPFGANFGGSWFPGAALIAVLANVYIFYGFESAGDIAEEVVDARRRVPRAMVLTMIVGGITSFILVGAFALAIPGHSLGNIATGGLAGILQANIHTGAIYDAILIIACLAFFSCGSAVQAAGARVLFSYARDNQLPGSRALRTISPRLRTPVVALLVVAILPALFALLAHVTFSHPVHFLWITLPASVNALALLVSFATSGIYLSFQMVVLAAIIARARGWRPRGFDLGRWAWPVYILAFAYGVGMLVNIIFPSPLSSPRAALFNFGWTTLLVMFVIAVLGALWYFIGRPYRRQASGVEEGGGRLATASGSDTGSGSGAGSGSGPGAGSASGAGSGPDSRPIPAGNG